MLLALVLPSIAHAQFATGGGGLYRDNIVWFQWGTINTVPGQDVTNVTPVAGQFLRIRCTQNNSNSTLLVRTIGNNAGGRGLAALYNQGANQWGIALGTRFSGVAATFTLSCSATFGPTGTAADPPYAIDGLVVADGEQADGPGEFEQGSAAAAATWRIIDRYRAADCPFSVQATLTPATNTLRLAGDPLGFCQFNATRPWQSPVAVAFLDGATSAFFQVQGSGLQAIAVGVFVNVSDQGDAPASYGVAQHLPRFTWSGGTVTGTQEVNEPAFQLATQSAAALPRLGATVETEISLPPTNATADDTTGIDDEDALTGPVALLGGALNDIPCTGTGAAVRGFVDWNQDGDFTDAGEASAPATWRTTRRARRRRSSARPTWCWQRPPPPPRSPSARRSPTRWR